MLDFGVTGMSCVLLSGDRALYNSRCAEHRRNRQWSGGLRRPTIKCHIDGGDNIHKTKQQIVRQRFGAGLDSKERLSRPDGYGSTSEPVADKSSGRACQGLRRRGDGAVWAAGASLRYLPHYNPIEMAFAKLKALLRAAAARTIPDLWQTIADALRRFTPQECANYLAAAGYDAK